MCLLPEENTVELSLDKMPEVARIYGESHDSAVGAVRDAFQELVKSGKAPDITELEKRVQKLTEAGAEQLGADKIDNKTMEKISKAVEGFKANSRGRPTDRGVADAKKGNERSRSRETTLSKASSGSK